MLLSTFSCTCWLFITVPLGNVFSNLLPMLKLGCLTILSGIWFFVREMDCKYFFPVRGLPVHFLMVSFDERKFVILILVKFN